MDADPRMEEHPNFCAGLYAVKNWESDVCSYHWLQNVICRGVMGGRSAVCDLSVAAAHAGGKNET